MSDMRSYLIQNRWLVTVGAVLIQLALGAIYAWSVFTQKLTDPSGDYRFSASDAAWIFSAGLATFALSMVLAGKWQSRIRPAIMSASGGIILGAGYILGGLYGGTFWTQLVFIGVIGGAGIGLAYAVPIAVGIRWFPDKKGMVTGLAVAGFGFGATIWVQLAGSWFGGMLNTVSLFGFPGVQSVFLVYGVAFASLVLIGSTVMINPPDGYAPRGWTPPDPRPGNNHGAVNYEVRAMLRTPQFYAIWTVFMVSALAGLMVIYCIKLFGIDTLEYQGVANAGAITGSAMAWYAIFNGIGRIAWGTVSDRIGRRNAVTLMAFLQGMVMLSTYHVFITVGHELGFVLVACLIGFNFGGNFALFPAITADFFGNRNVGANYGWVFTAYGVAGLAGPPLAGYFKDLSGEAAHPIAWMVPFVIAGVACLVGAVVMIRTRAPESRVDPARRPVYPGTV